MHTGRALFPARFTPPELFKGPVGLRLHGHDLAKGWLNESSPCSRPRPFPPSHPSPRRPLCTLDASLQRLQDRATLLHHPGDELHGSVAEHFEQCRRQGAIVRRVGHQTHHRHGQLLRPLSLERLKGFPEPQNPVHICLPGARALPWVALQRSKAPLLRRQRTGGLGAGISAGLRAARGC